MAWCAVTHYTSVLHALAGRDRGPTVAATRARPIRGGSGVRVGGGRAAAASDPDPPSPTRRERRDAHRDARHAKLAGRDGGSRVSRAAATIGLARETVRLAGGVDRVVERAEELAFGIDETRLEVALGLATDATRVASEDARHAARILVEARVQEEAGESSPAGPREDTPADPYLADPSGHPSVLDLENLENLEKASRSAARTSARASDVLDDIRARLSRRLIEDEWLALIASVAATDFRRDRKKPRVRARDRRCNQPKARQGWTKKAMRAARVRVCAGCDRMLPAEELIRIVRVSRTNTENAENAEGDAEQGIHADAAKDESATKKKKKSASHAARVVALDVSSFLPGAGAEALAASVALGGPFAAATRDCPDAARAAVALASRGASFLETETETETHTAGDGASLAAERAERELGSPREKRFSRLAGRAAYVCRRGHCARSVAKAKAFKRHLKVSPGGADASDARRFYEDLIGVCELAETLDGVDSSRWAFTREPGTPSRWEAHPVAVDRDTGEEVASERAKRLAVGGSGADGGAV